MNLEKAEWSLEEKFEYIKLKNDIPKLTPEQTRQIAFDLLEMVFNQKAYIKQISKTSLGLP